MESLRLLKPGGVFTYYSNEPECFSEDHEMALRAQGWDIIEYKAIAVTPPEDCEYWKWPTIMVPRLFKAQK
jgi:guanidinoacetate N-methyltransferase